MNAPWVHNLSPFLIQFTDSIGIRWYGLAYLIGFALTYLMLDQLAKKNRILLSREHVSDLVTYVAIGTLVGGRLGYALFYSPDLFFTFHSSFPFWGLLEVNKGGMASHGGIIGIAVAAILFAYKNKLMATHLVDLLCVSGPVGVFFGRIANFINGELYGRECARDFWLAVQFPSEIYTWGASDADKLKALAPAVEAIGPVVMGNGQTLVATASLWLEWVDTYSRVAQVNINIFKEAIVNATQQSRPEVIQALSTVLTTRYPSQLIQALLEGLLVFLILAFVWRKPRKPGLITALFGILYAANRIIGEQFRLPDHGIGFQALGLTRGQWLSVAMMTLFVVYLVFVLRRRVEPIGGWKS